MTRRITPAPRAWRVDVSAEDMIARLDHPRTLFAREEEREEARDAGRPSRRRPLDPNIFHVRYKRCAECLYSAARLPTEASAERYKRDARESGGYFVCHHYGVGEGEGVGVCCRGFFDNENTLATALARMLGVVRFVDDDGVEVAPADGVAPTDEPDEPDVNDEPDPPIEEPPPGVNGDFEDSLAYRSGQWSGREA